MPLEVIGAGFGRTGTKSLKIALESIGYDRCHHMMEVMKEKDQIDYWHRISKGENVSWDDVFADFQAAVDWPSAHYYKELAEHFPEAKVVLSVRDPEAWYTSVSETIFLLSSASPKWLRVLVPKVGLFYEMVQGIVWAGKFEGRFEDKAFALKVFQDNIDEAQRVIPPERLLLHKPQDGWEPLCEFLGKPVPDMPYPRVNEAKEIKKALKVMWLLSALPWIILLLSIAGMTYCMI